MPTFSQLVDQLTTEMSRPDRRATLAEMLNSTIREMHFSNAITARQKPGQLALLFAENLREQEWIVPSEPVVWAIPKPSVFQAVEAAYDNDRAFHYQLRRPGVMGQLADDFNAVGVYYRSGSSLCFSGSYVGNTILLSWYEFLPALVYKAPNARVVVETEPGTYERVGGGSPLTESELAAEVNWMLDRHAACLRLGTLTKAYISIGDKDRANTLYSSYEQMKHQIQITEATA